KASVVLRLRGGLDSQAQLAIANLVAGAVEKLHPENVSVVDADTNRPLGDSGDRDLAAQGTKYEDQLAAKLVQTLEPVAGRGRVRASIHLERDLTSGEETQETYDPSATVALTMQRSEERLGSSAPSGVPGTASNVPGASGPGVKTAATEDSSQTSKSENGTYAVNKLVRHTLLPAGRVKRITAAVLVDDAVESRAENGAQTESRRKRTAEELKQMEELARASLGLDTTRGDSLSVQNLSFQSEPVPSPIAPTVPERVRVVVQQWSSLFRLGAVGVLFFAVYLMLLRPVKNQLVTSFREMSQRLRAKAGKPAIIEGAVQGAQNSLEGESVTPESVRLKKQVLGKAKSDPLATSRLLQSWMREEGAK
ncbi:MAG: flagellar basal-body MS-ring/collar protein FliF, partial [Acidobacteriaceae bacterium]